jgi:hypothetical protein
MLGKTDALLLLCPRVRDRLRGWGGRIRNIAFRMIVIKLERFRRKAEECKPAP